MRVNDDYPTWNAASQVGKDDSVFAFWKRMLEVRKQYDVLVMKVPLSILPMTLIRRQVYGDFALLFPEHEQLFAYTRSLKAGTVALVIMNFSKKEVEFKGPAPGTSFSWDGFEYVIGTGGTNDQSSSSLSLTAGGFVLKPYEGRLYISTSK